MAHREGGKEGGRDRGIERGREGDCRHTEGEEGWEG